MSCFLCRAPRPEAPPSTVTAVASMVTIKKKNPEPSQYGLEAEVAHIDHVMCVVCAFQDLKKEQT